MKKTKSIQIDMSFKHILDNSGKHKKIKEIVWATYTTDAGMGMI